MPDKNIVFAGTPDFAAAHLQVLIDDGYPPSLVLTQPDRTAGRGQKLSSSPVKMIAQTNHLPIFQPEKLDIKAKTNLENLTQPDLLIVVAYGLLLPRWMLNWAKYGAINVHASLLPRWRGAAPIQRAIEQGDTKTGISIMQMDAGLDTGDIWRTVPLPITAEMTAQQLHNDLQNRGGKALIDILPIIFAGQNKPLPQAQEGITYAKKLSKAEAQINWSTTADIICRKIHAFNPVPVAHSKTTNGIQYRFYKAIPQNTEHQIPVGQVIREDKNGIIITCQAGTICVSELQEIGKKRLLVKDFLNGNTLTGQQFT
ncbi:MAG: methionyl-tRNA formyltransferase [Ostreibacterium sp.]